MTPIQRARWKRNEARLRLAWDPPGRPAWEWAAEKAKAERNMAEYELAASVWGYRRARISETELRAGPLLTDDWDIAPVMRGVGRRLGALNVAELEAEQ